MCSFLCSEQVHNWAGLQLEVHFSKKSRLYVCWISHRNTVRFEPVYSFLLGWKFRRFWLIWLPRTFLYTKQRTRILYAGQRFDPCGQRWQKVRKRMVWGPLAKGTYCDQLAKWRSWWLCKSSHLDKRSVGQRLSSEQISHRIGYKERTSAEIRNYSSWWTS